MQVCLLAILVGMLVITGPSSSPSSGWKLLTMASGFLTLASNSTASLLVRSPLSKKGWYNIFSAGGRFLGFLIRHSLTKDWKVGDHLSLSFSVGGL